MTSFEVLCVTMHQKDFSKIREMNIHSDVVFANQCDKTAYEEINFDGFTAKMISTNTRGVGINRNLALMYASADICLMADDDVVYNDNYREIILSEFESHPDADVFIFHFDTDDLRRTQEKYPKTRKCGRLEKMPWGGIRIAFRLSSVKKANVNFTTLFGGGCKFPSGEDSMWLIDAKRKGLTFYVSKETIGRVSFAASTWFTGYDEKFFFAKGVFCEVMHKKTSFLWMLYYSIRFRSVCNYSMSCKINWMLHGKKAYREMLSFEEYKEKYNL